jgi:hypothetical protein
MNEPLDQELHRFESDLRRIPPAPAPEQLVNRLLANRPRRAEAPAPIRPVPTFFSWSRLLGWLVPATAVGLVLFISLRHSESLRDEHPTAVQQAPTNLAGAPTASHRPQADAAEGDELEIGRTWIATYDAVAELPNGEPIRFRCREWADTTLFRDKARGIAVERSTPRLEITPIRFETY